MSIRVAHLSDLHAVADPDTILGGRKSSATLKATLDAFTKDSPPDLMILTGDISDDASADSYQWVSEMVRDAAPITRWLAGNHDDPAAMDQPALLATGGASIGAWDYIPVSSQLNGKHFGGVGDNQLTALDSLLEARQERFVVLGIHHPPLHDICPHVDCQLEDAAGFLDLVSRHKSIRAVLSGHLHAHFEIERDGVQFLGAPSSWIQLAHGVGPHYRPSEDLPAGREVILHDDGTVTSRLVAAALGNDAS